MTITAILWDNVVFSFNSFAETLSLINFEPKIWAISGSELEISINTNLEDDVTATVTNITLTIALFFRRSNHFLLSFIFWHIYCLLFSSGGLLFLKLKYNAMSYAIFSTPPNTNGADKNESECSI
jgi:hypothetical protein